MDDRILDRADPAVDDDLKVRIGALETIDAIIIERRDVAVLARRQSVEPGFTRVHDQRIGAGQLHFLRERIERCFGILVVDADAAFHGHGDRHRGLHRHNAVSNKIGLGHQTGAEPAFLHAVRRAADIEIDFTIAEIRPDARAFLQLPRIGASKLQRDRVLESVKAEQPLAITVDHGAGRDHLGIEHRPAREQPMEEPAMPVRPFHHRGDAEAAPGLRLRSVHGREMAQIAPRRKAGGRAPLSRSNFQTARRIDKRH